MINEISNVHDNQAQINKPGNRNKENQLTAALADKSGEFDTKDVVEISLLKPVQAVTEDKTGINSSSDARNAENIAYKPETAIGTAKTAQANELAPDDASSAYGKRKSGIGKFLDTIA